MTQFEPNFKQAEFVLKFLRNELSLLEQAELNQWIAASESNRALFNELTDQKNVQVELAIMEQFPSSEGWESIKANKINPEQLKPILKKNSATWLFAAAAILVSLVIGIFQFRENPIPSNNSLIANLEKAKKIPAGSNKALITTQDGTIFTINDSTEGFLSKQNEVDLLVKNGQVIYQAIGKNEILQYNTISIPKGGQYKMILADGTKVWLNASSSLKFPIAFVGKDRKVELSGEAYFEVAHDASKPFIVSLLNGGEVQAIGTSFNVNAYPDETDSKTTLIEGKIKISYNNQMQFLTPGQQIQINELGKIVPQNNINTDEVMAWKNGKFIFISASLNQIMKQIERWYSIEVSFENNKSVDKFSGIFNRTGNLSEVLKILAEGGVKFKLDGNNLIVY